MRTHSHKTDVKISGAARNLLPPPSYGKLPFILLASAIICVGSFSLAVTTDGKEGDIYAAWGLVAFAIFVIALIMTGIRQHQRNNPPLALLQLIPEGAECTVMHNYKPVVVVDRSNRQLYLATGRAIPLSDIKRVEWEARDRRQYLNLYLNGGEDPYVNLEHFAGLDDLKRDYTWLLNGAS